MSVTTRTNNKTLWGCATAAYQIEGGYNQDGRKDSIWDVFSKVPGNVLNGDTGDVACDHYNRFKEDVKMMRDMGLQTYRFSISWPRVLPDGTGKVNEKGLEFYEKLADELLSQGIVPCATLYHWDLPQALQEKGGWNNKDVVKWFLEYARIIYKRLGNKISYIMTFNEIHTFIDLGYNIGIFAPGIKDKAKALDACHNVLLAHGNAVRLARQMKIKAKIGAAIDIWPRFAYSADHIIAAERENGFNHFWEYDAIIHGKYPAAALKKYQSDGVMPRITDEDMAIISEKMDFVGLNYYSAEVVKEENGTIVNLDYTGRKNTMGWKICPQGLYYVLKRLYNETHLPIMISENGAPGDDVLQDGKVNDTGRIDFMKEHIDCALKAKEDGVELLAYQYWSIMDNYEWSSGYSRRFGLVYVDYETQKRYLKDSAKWYSEFIKTQQ